MDQRSAFQGYQPTHFADDRDTGSPVTNSNGNIYQHTPPYPAAPGIDSGYSSPTRSMNLTNFYQQPLAFAPLHPANNAAEIKGPRIIPRSISDNSHLIRGALQLMDDEVDDIDIECK